MTIKIVQRQEEWEQRFINVCPNEPLEELEEKTWGNNDQETKVDTKHPSPWTTNSLCSHKHTSDFPLICFLILPFKIILTDCLQ